MKFVGKKDETADLSTQADIASFVLSSNSKTETSASSTYPVGTSIMDVSDASWPEQYGVVTTSNINVNRCTQTYSAKVSGSQWTRTAANDVWGAWHSVTKPWTQMTQAEYDALTSPDPSTLYVIVG